MVFLAGAIESGVIPALREEKAKESQLRMRNGCIMVRYIVTLSFVKLPYIESFEILAVRLAVEVEAAQQWRFKQWRYKQGDR
ncbi:putative RING finger protein P32A8.03c [Fusarium oxysporum f. sp. albedinis]|nr:putative RING finger protein P32A8.03c [Fusarium oxysporum f. sp. albedinis]